MQSAHFICIFLLALLGVPTFAQVATTPEQNDPVIAEASSNNADVDEEVATEPSDDGELTIPDHADLGDEVDAASGSLDDAAGSIAAAREIRGWHFRGDLRVGYSHTDTDSRDTGNQSSSEWSGRFRAGGSFNFSETLVLGGRLASPCSTERCDPDPVLDGTLPTQSSINDGDITFDELYIHGFRRQKFDVAIGRLQTKFVSRAGVFTKSLDRNDSNGTNVNWTDGLHGTLHLNADWAGHLILQKNQADGTGNIRREPLDFNHEDSRITYFLAAENVRRVGPINQQGFDITYMPRSLMKDGNRDGRIEDYIAIVGRFAASWPEGSTGPRLNIAGEIGHAPETPTRAAMGLTGSGDSDGLAWIFSASLVDFHPNHSIGINYGRTDAGWLLSPDYRNNEQAVEIRYVWRRSRNLAIDIRGRWREELEQLASATRKQKELNAFARFTWGFGY